MDRLISLFKGKCPSCYKGEPFQDKGNIFTLRFPKMNKTCPVCNHKFEKEVGFFFGAMYVSYGLNVAEGMAVYVLARLIYFDDPFDPRLLFFIIGLMVLLWFVNFRFARLIWMYMFTSRKVTS